MKAIGRGAAVQSAFSPTFVFVQRAGARGINIWDTATGLAKIKGRIFDKDTEEPSCRQAHGKRECKDQTVKERPFAVSHHTRRGTCEGDAGGYNKECSKINSSQTANAVGSCAQQHPGQRPERKQQHQRRYDYAFHAAILT